MIRSIDVNSGLVLVGYRGTGKSTVGQIVAQRLDRPFVDADHELEARAGRSIRSIFDEQGEPAFRDLEEAVLRELAGRRGVVLSTGGGAILRESNRRAIRECGLVVWLTAPPAVLAGRLRWSLARRPALTAAGTIDEIVEVLEARAPLYAEAADLAIETAHRSAWQVADNVLEAWARFTRAATEVRP